MLVIGIWPLVSLTVSDGTMAWLFIGANNATYSDQGWGVPWPIEFLSLESIPSQNTMHDISGFRFLWPSGTPNVTDPSGIIQSVNASYSNTASILQCNPNFRNETRLIKMANETFTIHEVVSPNDVESTEDWGYDGVGAVLNGILNPLLGSNSLKFSARRTWGMKVLPTSPVNWVAGELTLQALNNTHKSNVGGVAYYDVPLAPEVIASNIGRYVQSAARPYLAHSLSLPGTIAQNAQMQVSVPVLQTSLEQMVATIVLVALIMILAITLLIIGIGNLPLTVSTVETVLQGKEGNYG